LPTNGENASVVHQPHEAGHHKSDVFRASQAMSQKPIEPQPIATGVFFQPPDLLQFVSTEHQQFLTSLINCHEEIGMLSHVHGLYAAAMTNQTTDRSTVVIFQLLTFVPYHFLFASSSYMRCHMAEGFSSARAAIDAALIASQVIHDRPSQVAYINRTKPFDKLIRHFKNLITVRTISPYRTRSLSTLSSCTTFAANSRATRMCRLSHIVWSFCRSPTNLCPSAISRFPATRRQ
jgi:hypothetical protein